MGQRRRISKRKKRKVMWSKRIITVLIFGTILAVMNWMKGSVDIVERIEARGYARNQAEGQQEDADALAAQGNVVADGQELWALVLVNNDNAVESGYVPDVAIMDNGYYFDARAAGYLEQMIADMEAEGLKPKVCSGYRSNQKQQQLFRNKVKRERDKGLTYSEAVESAQIEVAYPGTSEHELGLAVDIICNSYSELDEGYADTAEAKWLAVHCHEYGFILRYPEDKEAVTKYIYEPWHFRFVGMGPAEEIMENGLCLEEYLEQLS